jgi:hypothetical protein
MEKNSKQQLTLNKVTPQALKNLKQFGLLDSDARQYAVALLEVCTDEEKTKSVLATIYQDDFSKLKFDEFDTRILSEGLTRFLQKFINASLN